MTTSNSPIGKLRTQARQIAFMLKQAEQGKLNNINGYTDKVIAARGKPSITFGVVQDDKVLKITMSWETIKDTEINGITEFILDYMRGRVPSTKLDS